MIGITYTYTSNIGDEFQIIGLTQLLKNIGIEPNFQVNRDTLDCPWADAPIGGKLIINGWLAEREWVIKSLLPQVYSSYKSRTNRNGRIFLTRKT